jgi:1,4-dihydroxy-2-naphthoate octaprenyltransferase
MKVKTWFLETRPQFLILSIVLVFLGTAIAWYDGFFNLTYALLAGLGLLLAHASVNALNDYFDYRSGIDQKAPRTPFSGGSGLLPTGKLKPRDALVLGLLALLLAVPIGIFFVIQTGWQLLPLLVVAALCVVLYSPVILKCYWPEWAPGLGLGLLPVMGTYFVQAGEYNWPVVIAAVPSFILVHNLLFLNEFPDVEADKTASRKTTTIVLGRARARKLYTALTLLMYLWIIGAVIAGAMPLACLVALLTFPLAVKAIRLSADFHNPQAMIPALANNVMVILITQFLLGVGYIIARIMG